MNVRLYSAAFIPPVGGGDSDQPLLLYVNGRLWPVEGYRMSAEQEALFEVSAYIWQQLHGLRVAEDE